MGQDLVPPAKYLPRVMFPAEYLPRVIRRYATLRITNHYYQSPSTCGRNSRTTIPFQ